MPKFFKPYTYSQQPFTGTRHHATEEERAEARLYTGRAEAEILLQDLTDIDPTSDERVFRRAIVLVRIWSRYIADGKRYEPNDIASLDFVFDGLTARETIAYRVVDMINAALDDAIKELGLDDMTVEGLDALLDEAESEALELHDEQIGRTLSTTYPHLRLVM